jgi:hypothetical protein
LTKRLKRAARAERVSRYLGMYAISAAVLMILLAPLWLWLLLA